MLVSDRELDPSIANAFEVSPEGYAALAAGNVALCGYSEDRAPEVSDKSIAELLLDQESTAVMHFEAPAADEPAEGLMIAANYHNGHSEGHNLIVVQHPLKPELGQYMIHHYPGADNTTFYKRHFLGSPQRFQRVPSNPEKIREYYVHTGEADEAIVAFRALGYDFSDELLPDDIEARFKEYSATQTVVWHDEETDFGIEW